jgi:hypothetical protein
MLDQRETFLSAANDPANTLPKEANESAEMVTEERLLVASSETSKSNSGDHLGMSQGIIISRTKRQRTPSQVSAEKLPLFPMQRCDKPQIQTLSKCLFSREQARNSSEKPGTFGMLFPSTKLSSMFRDNLNKNNLQQKIRDFSAANTEKQ